MTYYYSGQNIVELYMDNRVYHLQHNTQFASALACSIPEDYIALTDNNGPIIDQLTYQQGGDPLNRRITKIKDNQITEAIKRQNII